MKTHGNTARYSRSTADVYLFLTVCAFVVACASSPSGSPGTTQTLVRDAVPPLETPPPAATCADVLAWWANEGLALRKVAGSNTRYSLEWLPSVCNVCKERPTAGLDDPDVRAAIAALGSTQQYIVRCAAIGAPEDRNVDLGAVTSKDVYQLHAGDTAFAALYHAERLPDNVPHRTAIVGFEHQLGIGQRQVVLSQPGKEAIRFRIPAAAVSNFLALFRSPSNSVTL